MRGFADGRRAVSKPKGQMDVTVVVSFEDWEDVADIFDAVSECCERSQGRMIYEGGYVKFVEEEHRE
jgi:hypothetical protein